MCFFWWSKPRDVRIPVVVRTKGVEDLPAKRTEDVSWRVREEFNFRKHLWISMTTSIRENFNVLGSFLVSAPFRLYSALLNIVEEAKSLPLRLSLRSRNSSPRPKTQASGEKNPEQEHHSEKDPDTVAITFMAGEIHTKASIIFLAQAPYLSFGDLVKCAHPYERCQRRGKIRFGPIFLSPVHCQCTPIHSRGTDLIIRC